MMVLVVDDDIVSRMVLMHMVDSCGAYEIFEADDGEDAWSQLRQGLRPAICFCDLRMPRLSGMELLARVRADPALACMRFVLASSANDQATMEQANSLGADGCIVKPFEPDTVRAQLAGLARAAAGSVDEAGKPLATMQRLGIEAGRLLLYLGGFESQLAAAGPGIAALISTGQPGEVRALLERLQAGCLTLGLAGAAARLEALLGGAPGEARMQAAIDAVLAAVRQQAQCVRAMQGGG